MTTSGITSKSGSGSAGNTVANPKGELKAEDFIKMMITQLQNQDPMEPAKNSELLSQMSQIGQLQSNTQMQESFKGLVLQNQIGSAGNLIGKKVKGLSDDGDPVEGVVNSIKVEKDKVKLELDNGKALELGRITQVANAPGGVTTKATAGNAVTSKTQPPLAA